MKEVMIPLRPWARLTLVVGCSVEHAEDLQDVAVAIVALELVSGAVEAQDQLPRLAVPTRANVRRRHVDGRVGGA